MSNDKEIVIKTGH